MTRQATTNIINQLSEAKEATLILLQPPTTSKR